MGKHTGPVSGSSYSQCTQQLARRYLRLTWSRAPVYLLFVTAKCSNVTLVRVEGREGVFLPLSLQISLQILGYQGALEIVFLNTQLLSARLLANTFSLKSPSVSCQ